MVLFGEQCILFAYEYVVAKLTEPSNTMITLRNNKDDWNNSEVCCSNQSRCNELKESLR